MIKSALQALCQTAVGVFVLATSFNQLHASCWSSLEQSAIGSKSPIIITGKITEIDVAAVAQRCFDVAHIKVESIHKNVLDDYPLKVGDTVLGRMHGKNQQTSISNDLEYTKGKLATWYLYLEKDRNFYICRHIQQCQPVTEKPSIGWSEMRIVERRIGAPVGKRHQTGFSGGRSTIGRIPRQSQASMRKKCGIY